MPSHHRPAKDVRADLIAVAARLIATEGAAGLTLRRVADETGTSTMAVYTHFGGMPELRRAVRREGFARLAAHLARVPESDDPVADAAMLGRAYYENAIANPHLYRAMFMERPVDVSDAAAGWSDTFYALVAGMRRCIDAGRFSAADPVGLATQFWALGHGVIALQLADLLTEEQARACLRDAAVNLLTAYADDRDAVRKSLERARRRRPTASGTTAA